MGPIGNFVGALWFFMLFLAAITSSISMYQPSLAFFQESLGWSRKNATSLMVGICLVASFLVMYYSKGSIFWATIDDWVGTFLIFVLAMVQIIASAGSSASTAAGKRRTRAPASASPVSTSS